MEASDIVLGNVYWCIRPSLESEGYGDDAPRRPWRGMLTKPNYLSMVDENGLNPDDDTNATSLVEPENLFLSRDSARAAYVRAMIVHLVGMTRGLEDGLLAIREELGDA